MLSVDCLVHRAHFLGGDLAGKRIERDLDLRPSPKGLRTHQRNGLIGREVVAVILKGGEA